MSAVDDLFAELRRTNRKAFISFVTAGDPDLDFTADVLRELSAQGTALCELGIPYSDPIADGPVIQASYTRALEQKIRLSEIFDLTAKVTPDLACPVVMMVSYAIVYRNGLENFVQQAKAAGVSGAIVPDLLVEEADDLSKICADHDFSLIQLVTPTTPRERAVKIAQSSSGFIYFVSVTGITGERSQLPDDLLENVAWLRQQTDLPVCIGFGINQPEHVAALSPVADGVIVGSAIMRRIAEHANDRNAAIRAIGNYVSSLMNALSD